MKSKTATLQKEAGVLKYKAGGRNVKNSASMFEAADAPLQRESYMDQMR